MRKYLALAIGFILILPLQSVAKIKRQEPELSFPHPPSRSGPQEFIDKLKEIIRQNPYVYENYERLAFAYDYIGDYQKELATLKLAERYLPPDYPQKDAFFVNLGRAYILNGQYEAAKLYLDKAQKINPKNPFLCWQLFLYYVHKQQYSLACDQLKVFQSIVGEKRNVYEEAMNYFNEYIKDEEEKLKFFKTAVETNPKSYQAHYVRGLVLQQTKEKEAFKKRMLPAIEEFKTTLKLKSSFLPAYVALGNTYLMCVSFRGDESCLASAEEWFKKGEKINPYDLNLVFCEGVMYYLRHDYTKAIRKLEYAVRHKDKEAREVLAAAYNDKAYQMCQEGKNLKRALRLAEKALQIKPLNAAILSTKAELLYKLKRYKEAYRYIKTAHKLMPEAKEIREDLARIEKALAAGKRGEKK